MRENTYKSNLIMRVINNSESSEWQEAVEEWEIIDCEEDVNCLGECICGKEDIKYLYTIRNRFTSKELFPIGSSCIRKFNRADLSEETTLREEQFKLLHAVEENQFLSLNSDLFSRKLLLWLYEEGAFNNLFNDGKGYNDYEFMLKMFNKRDKDSITVRQHRKIKAIILNSIKPFIQDRLSEKTR